MSEAAVRRAIDRDVLDAMRVLDGAMLEIDADTVQRCIDAGTVLVAVDDDRVVGALVATERTDETDGEADDEADDATNTSGAHVEAVAVRRRRRAQGIGTRLVVAAAERWPPLTAEFDADVKPFYEELGFDCEEADDGEDERFRGVLSDEA